jgi:hypothetical protein
MEKQRDGHGGGGAIVRKTDRRERRIPGESGIEALLT